MMPASLHPVHEVSGVEAANSFGIFVRKNADSFHYMALNLTRNEDDARDLVASTWARMWRFIEKFDERRASMLTWGVTIMRNQWFEECQRRKYRNRFPRVELDAETDERQKILEVLAEHGPSHYHRERELVWIRAAITRAMGILSPSERLAVESKLKGQDGATAARELGWPRRSVDARAFDAYNKMRPVLAGL